MTRKRSICAMSLAFLACLIAEAADGPRQNRDLDREFQAAVAQYHSGHYPEAASKLENLVREAPESFEVQELLGLVYSAQSQDARATQHLQKAVHLKPNSAPARTNLAANLARLGKLDLATEQFKKAVELDPRNYDDAVKSLLRATDLNPADPGCYLFLSKAYDSSPGQAGDVIQRFRRFAELQPSNARALYYYAMSLWKGKRAQDPDLDLHQI